MGLVLRDFDNLVSLCAAQESRSAYTPVCGAVMGLLEVLLGKPGPGD